MAVLGRLSRTIEAVGRIVRDVNAVTRGPGAIIRRTLNKIIGRNIVRRLWFR